MRSYPIKASAVVVTALLMFCSSFAQTTFNNGGGDHFWFNPLNWNNGLPAAGNNATIPAGFSPVVNLSADYLLDFNVINGGNLTINPSAFEFRSSLTFTNNGVVSNSAVFINQGNYINAFTSGFTNFGTIRNISGALFTNIGNLTNGGNLINAANGNIINSGFIQINGSGVFNNNGSFTNNNAVDNYGQINHNASSFINNGLITNFNDINNASNMLISASGNINSGGLFQNTGGAILTIEGVFTSTTTLENDGSIINNGNMTTSGVFNNNAGVFTNNESYLNNGGDINNFASIINNSSFSNAGDLINDDGSFVNATCAFFYSQPGAGTSNTGSGSFTNNGIAYQLGGSMIQITTNNGALLTELAQDPTPEALCVAQIPAVLNAANMATVTTAQIDAGSHADYCPGVTLSLNPSNFNCSNIGNNIVTLTATDTYNNTSTCTAVVVVSETVAPVITCPANISIQAPSFACGATYGYNVTATDNCNNTTIIQTDATGLSSGDEFPIGTTTVSYRAQDLSGNSDDCSFSITVLEFVPVTQALTCDNLVHVSLEADCISEIRPQALLEGSYSCENDFTVLVGDTGDNLVTSDEIGQTLSVTVINNETGMSCWGLILVEDKLSPVISCINETLVCSAPETAHPLPVITDCSDYTLSFTDNVTIFNCGLPLTSIRYRTYVATDAWGNTATCVQTIQYQSGDIDDVLIPADITISCDVNWTPDDNGHPIPSPGQNAAAGRPGTVTLGGFPVYPSNGFCQFDVAYSDQEVPACDGSYKIIRTWTLVDWCSGDIRQQAQIIKIMDNTPPVITCPADETISTAAASCFGSILLEAATATDNCSSTIILTQTSSQGTIGANNVFLSGLPIGNTIVTYTAIDGCDNSATCTINITVEDQITPTPVCDEITQIAVDNNGLATAYADDLDDGSNDNCGIAYFEVRRMESDCVPGGTTFGPSVSFTCCDVTDTVLLVLRVWDVNDNYNDCMIQAYIEDKIDPIITCPENIEIYCDDDLNIWDLEQFGQPEYFDNCDVDTTYTREWDLGQCHTGFIYRNWIVTDPNGNTDECAQKITILHHSDFVVDFPEDITFNDCNTGTLQEPVVSDDDCELVAVNYVDLPFEIVPDACYKIIRTWTVVNWCIYDANNPNLTTGGIVLDADNHIIQDDGDGYTQYQQIIKIIDIVPPVITSPCEDVTFNDFSNEDDNLNDADPTTSCDGWVSLSIDAEDTCVPSDELNYTYSIYLDGDLNSTPLTGTSNLVEDEFPYGTHLIKWEVEDGCGNITYCEYFFTVQDRKKPSVICHNGVAANLIAMDTNGDGEIDANMAVVWDTEILQSWDDNCTPNDALKLRITDVVGTNNAPDTKFVTFDCTDLGPQAVELWVGDNAGNWDYCETFIDIQDNAGVCGPVQAMATISGELMTEENEYVANATVQLQGMNNNFMYSYQTTNEGIYQVNVTADQDYLITAERGGDFGNGVSTYDIVLITKHILGIQSLGSPYKLIAADVNNNAAVTAMDLVEIRKLILGVTTSFPNNQSWRFIDRNYIFPNPVNPWQSDFPEAVTVQNIDPQESLQADFIATKIGDVNNSVIANLNQMPETGSRGTVYFKTEYKDVKAGETFELNIAAGSTDMSGFQFTLGFDVNAVELVNILPVLSGISDENFGVFEDAITTSWNGDIKQAGETLFTLTFRAKTAIVTNEVFRVNSSRTIAEAYNKSGEISDIALVFDNGIVSSANSFELFQNEPNPFGDETNIRFCLPEASLTKLSIVDAAGRKIWATEQVFQKGYTTVSINEDILPGTGVYFYILENNQYTATKKMLFNK